MARGGNGIANRGNSKPFPQRFIGTEEEQLILLYRSAHGTTEVVPLEWRQTARRKLCLVVEEIAGVQDVVAKVLKQRSMKAVGAALGGDRHLTSHGQTVFGAEGISDH